MRAAFEEAKKAFFENEVPVGAIAVMNDKIIARAHNNKKKTLLFFGHAEFLVLKKLNNKIKNHYFSEISFYSTLEPCLMCIGALIATKVKKLYFGADNFKSGFSKDISFCSHSNSLKKISIKKGFLAKESEALLKSFFVQLRKKK
ncbi:MAG: nucleoside deaminase [Vigna little leaf phytoplasma]|nr:nucleoside deaminase [Vigna little leaf phytoplasma]